MKLYQAQAAPNCRRVRIFLAEKGVEVPVEQIDLVKGENRQEPYISRNPMGGVPMLELDDGTFLAESVAICRYFEELHPEPALMGTNAREKALIEMWQRRMELEVAIPIMNCFRNTHEFFKGRIDQVPEYGEVSKSGALRRLAWLDSELGGREFVAGDRYSIADITALIGIDFGRVVGIKISDDQPNLARWHKATSSRASAKA